MIFELIVFFVILLIIVGIGYYIYNSFPITDCSKYGKAQLPSCPEGTQEFAGICYTDNWTKNGGKKTAICSVSYPGDGSLYTNCTGDIGAQIRGIYTGDICSNLSLWDHTDRPGLWVKTAYCTCQRGGTTVTVPGGYNCEGAKLPNVCPSDTDFFEGVCYGGKCPEGYTRTEICTCARQ